MVGGGVSDLPDRYKNHPAILLWDDNQQAWMNKEVPANIRAVLYNRWISHSGVSRLNNEIDARRLIKFPMLRTSEIKVLLSEIVPMTLPRVSEEPEAAEVEVESREPRPTAPEGQGILTKEEVEAEMAATKQPKGALMGFIAKHIKLGVDWSVKGSKATEGMRLFELAKKEGLKTTKMSMLNAVGVFVRRQGGENRNQNKRVVAIREARSEVTDTVASRASSKGSDDFKELERLIDDAITAMKLVSEHLPNVRKETERLRGMREKMLKMLGVE